MNFVVVVVAAAVKKKNLVPLDYSAQEVRLSCAVKL